MEKSGEFSAEFLKSRNRLIYICGLGILLIWFPLSTGSSLFGLKFGDQSPEAILIIILILSISQAIPFFFRWMEEKAVLIGDYANIMTRTENAEIYGRNMVTLLENIRDSLIAKEEELEKRFEILRRISSDRFTDELKMFAESFQPVADQIKSHTQEIEFRMGNPENSRFPDKFSSSWGLARRQFDFWIGPISFVVFIGVWFYNFNLTAYFAPETVT